MRILLLVVLALGVTTPVFSQALKAEADIQPFTDKVMKALVKDGISAAFVVMKPVSIIPETEFDSVVLASKAQRDQYGARYGATIGYEYISSKKVGDSLVRVRYIEKTQKHAMPWVFYFYKASGSWVLNSFQWSDQMPVVFLGD